MRKLKHSLLCSVIVMVLAAAGQAQIFSVLYNFGTHSGDPENPINSGIIAQGRDGNLYSTTPLTNNAPYNGAVFKITTRGALNVLHTFTLASNGTEPWSGLTLGRNGNFYGTTNQGGTHNSGTIFKITPSGTLTILYDFNGGNPFAPPIQGSDGNFYGTTSGANAPYGTVFKLTPSGIFTTLHSFNGTDGEQPNAPLVQATDGNFYGTTDLGGSYNKGVVFKITPTGKLTTLYNFDGTHGWYPESPLIQGSDGNFYGTADTGGSYNSGVIFKITANGNLTLLHSLNGTTDGQNPVAGLVQATDGNFYGVAPNGGRFGYGTLFKITPSANFTVLHDFDWTTGAYPEVTLFQHTNGILYGETNRGNSSAAAGGVFYSLNIALHPFISLLSTSGKAGQVIEMLGSGLTGTTSVRFGSGSASFTVVSDTYMTVVVPATGTTGGVIVTTPSGLRVSNKTFRVLPVVSSFSPTAGPVGAQVVIKGTGLTQSNKATFGGVKATTFNVNSATQVTATVPTGAKTGQISITTAGGSAIGPGIFTVN